MEMPAFGRRAFWMMAGLLPGLIWAAPQAAYAQATIYVNGSTGDDTWSGWCETWDGATCGPKRTIQAGIGAAVPGDAVLVADGTYSGAGNRNLDFGGKSITVQSASGNPAMCIIDCHGGRGFYLHSGETAAAVAGFTIHSGQVFYTSPGSGNGGGVYCKSCNVSFTNCIISGNTAMFNGGGIYCASSNVTLTNCAISGNLTEEINGGGVACSNCTLTLTGCTITGNLAESRMCSGGGLFCSASRLTLTDCSIASNGVFGGSGGGMCLTGCASVTLTNCAVSNCAAPTDGGGIYCYSSNATLTNCRIDGNQSQYGSGGGVFCVACSPTFTNCTISGNEASTFGGGGGVSSDNSTLTNCILWGDVGGEIAGTATVTYSDVQGGYAGTGNIDADPHLSDFRPYSGSPCIDAGDPNFAPPPGARDLDGHQRVWDGNSDGTARVDMGAYEFGSYRYGDMNCDGLVDLGDVEPFVLALTDPARYAAAYPTCNINLSDLNADGAINAFDIDPFVALLTGG
jgi:parallel beta-helix repeat protein